MSKKNTIKIITLKKSILPLLFLFVCNVYSQQIISIQKSTITSVGSSTIYNNKYSVQQSIGQTGIIGKSDVNAISVQQGFLTNSIYFKIDNSVNEVFEESLDFVISPNPFIDHIKINFSKKTSHDIHIKIYDINGKIHFSNKYIPSDKIRVSMNKFSMGNYLIQIKSGKNISTKKLLKL